MKGFWAGILAVALTLSACTGKVPEQNTGFTFTDDLGRVVALEEMPTKTACLLGSFADVWMLAGGQVIAAPDDAWEEFRLELPEDAVVLGSTKNLSLELLLGCQPDFIIASSNTTLHMQWLETLEASGIPTAYFEVSDFDDYLRLLRLCTQITGREDLYRQNGLEIQSQIQQAIDLSEEYIRSSGHAPRVLYLRLAASGIRVKNSQGNVLGEMLRSLGCENIADSHEILLEQLSMELILMADPDIIFLVPQGDDTQGTQAVLDAFLRENPAWEALSAVRAGRVYTLDKSLYSLKPNNRWGQAYLALVELIWNEEE